MSEGDRKMTHREKKVAKIVEELTMYFFSVGADDIQSEIKRDGNQVTISFRANYEAEYRDTLDNLEEYLNEPKNEGIGDFYWELAGTGEPGETSQLLLIGMMIDRAEINIDEKWVSLVLYKELD